MGNINTEAEIVQWATTIVEGKGEKYIALSKGDQFAIAKYILAAANVVTGVEEPASEVKAEDIATGETVVSDTAVPVPDEGSYAGDPADKMQQAIDNPDICQTHGQTEETMPTREEAPTQKRTMLEALIARGFRSPQEAFDEFLKDTNGKDRERRVIDFSNGQMNIGPAFTWWLLGPEKGYGIEYGL